MRLLLVRHGESVANAEGRLQGQFDSPLSDLGRRQARALAARLAREDWAVSGLYSSDLSRAAETAEILVGALGVPLTLDARWREYDFGILNGVVWRDVEHLHPEIWAVYHRGREWPTIQGEESVPALQARVAGALDGIQAGHGTASTVMVVAHGGSLGMALSHLLGIEPRRPTPFRVDNASLSVVEFHARGPVLTRLNDTCHLDGDLAPKA